MTRLVIDPVTRVGGQLRVEVDVVNGTVADAWVSGTMYRGIERILEGRDPRSAWLVAQRICGRCGATHALASARAVETALGIAIPPNARVVRNILHGSRMAVDAAAGFYLRQALDWVDPGLAVDADPGRTAELARSISRTSMATAATVGVSRDRLRALFDASAPGPFASGYWNHPAYQLPPEANLLVMAHYLDALDWQREVMRLETVLGGKSPHPQSFLVGGMSLAPEWAGPRRPASGEHPWQLERNAPTALSPAGLDLIGSLVGRIADFVQSTYLPDVLLLARTYGEWSTIGRGIGNYLAFGEFPEVDAPEPSLLYRRGRVMASDLSAVVAVDQSGVAESVASAHYASAAHDAPGLVHPSAARTDPEYRGPLPPFRTFEGATQYSWVKAPRYEDDPMEVGPLARVLVGLAAGSQDVQASLDEVRRSVDLAPGGLQGTVGRIVARALEASILVRQLRPWLDALTANLASRDMSLVDITRWDPSTWPASAEGWALGESLGGAVGHWVAIADGRITGYQVVDGSTWNASPRDGRGRRGAIEAALVGIPVIDAQRPVEILRTIHSFDPCLACAVH